MTGQLLSIAVLPTREWDQRSIADEIWTGLLPACVRR
ncbi:hypothetical protein SAMN02787142_7636 [Burkholderia sp. WP9]|nr:hypothetical protein SAMN02787142_7636 [Burkholderia sp. WP9]